MGGEWGRGSRGRGEGDGIVHRAWGTTGNISEEREEPQGLRKGAPKKDEERESLSRG